MAIYLSEFLLPPIFTQEWARARLEYDLKPHNEICTLHIFYEGHYRNGPELEFYAYKVKCIFDTIIENFGAVVTRESVFIIPNLPTFEQTLTCSNKII